MAAASIANRFDEVVNNRRAVECDLTLNASYATGGDTVPLGALGLRNVTSLHILGYQDHNGTAVTPRGFQVVLAGTSTAPKVKAYSGSGSEFTGGSDASALGAIKVRFLGQ